MKYANNLRDCKIFVSLFSKLRHFNIELPDNLHFPSESEVLFLGEIRYLDFILKYLLLPEPVTMFIQFSTSDFKWALEVKFDSL